MKKFLTVLLLVLFLTGFAEAGIVFIEKGVLKVGIEDVTAGVFYDIREKEYQGGLFSSVVQYKTLNLDLGAIGNLKKIDEEGLPEPFAGLSTDVDSLNSIVRWGIEFVYNMFTKKDLDLNKSKVTTNVGSYVSYDINTEKFSSDNFGYGLYTGVKVTF